MLAVHLGGTFVGSGQGRHLYDSSEEEKPKPPMASWGGAGTELPPLRQLFGIQAERHVLGPSAQDVADAGTCKRGCAVGQHPPLPALCPTHLLPASLSSQIPPFFPFLLLLFTHSPPSHRCTGRPPTSSAILLGSLGFPKDTASPR